MHLPLVDQHIQVDQFARAVKVLQLVDDLTLRVGPPVPPKLAPSLPPTPDAD